MIIYACKNNRNYNGNFTMPHLTKSPEISLTHTSFKKKKKGYCRKIDISFCGIGLDGPPEYSSVQLSILHKDIRSGIVSISSFKERFDFFEGLLEPLDTINFRYDLIDRYKEQSAIYGINEKVKRPDGVLFEFLKYNHSIGKVDTVWIRPNAESTIGCHQVLIEYK